MEKTALAVAIIFNSAANVLIKNGMRNTDLSSNGVLAGIVRIFTNFYVIIGGLSFGIALVLYSIVLSKMELSVAYPIMTGSGFIIVLLCSIFIFGEPLLLSRTFGMLLIVVGIALVAWK